MSLNFLQQSFGGLKCPKHGFLINVRNYRARYQRPHKKAIRQVPLCMGMSKERMVREWTSEQLYKHPTLAKYVIGNDWSWWNDLKGYDINSDNNTVAKQKGTEETALPYVPPAQAEAQKIPETAQQLGGGRNFCKILVLFFFLKNEKNHYIGCMTIDELKEELKVYIQKFATAKKERDKLEMSGNETAQGITLDGFEREMIRIGYHHVLGRLAYAKENELSLEEIATSEGKKWFEKVEAEMLSWYEQMQSMEYDLVDETTYAQIMKVYLSLLATHDGESTVQFKIDQVFNEFKRHCWEERDPLKPITIMETSHYLYPYFQDQTKKYQSLLSDYTFYLLQYKQDVVRAVDIFYQAMGLLFCFVVWNAKAHIKITWIYRT
ncbi:hypothetical protein RFI_08131 [Reticulomyxa filosa]|uniref:Uncharacterized protein n=1 Tax=Reticulomyxa filosa TaxID=46433 RepID=X6NST5_RETFI|nr:hypothetical protein RFI_08131 [Reticulomyxa filosa]|eukprot:ETO28998.1 hypothetical protein RFI_08131 [Reticulomyxa filosa]